LQAWRQWVVLQSGDDWLPFAFHDYEAVPWPQPPPGSGVLMVKPATMRAAGTVTAQLRGEYSQFPDPPAAFHVDPIVEIGMMMLRDAIETEKHALRCANTFLTALHKKYEDRKKAAAALKVSGETWRRFEHLLAAGGRGIFARKFKSNEPRIDMTEQRKVWFLRVFRELIRRQGQLAAGSIPTDEFKSPRP
jgi:hypothetical protein